MDVPQYFYDARKNIVFDESGDIVYDIFDIINPNILYLLKTKKENMFVYTPNGEYVELIYEDHCEYLYGDHNQKIDRICIGGF